MPNYFKKTHLEKNIYYCKECNKLYNSCFELDNISMCASCFSEDLDIISENKIKAFIRNKRLEKINKISNE